jgi:BCD family chlorophyll transporter-like MFS transporter
MNALARQLVRTWAGLGTRFLPFADAASPDLPLPRLLRLALFQVSVGMATVLLIGTLNRVMIVELGVPASLVAVMIALPVLYAPFRALVGHRSDNHRSELGWRRVPYIWMGTLLQFGGLAIMPFALLVLSGRGDAVSWPAWIGPVSAGGAFLLVGAGLHTVQTAGLALATDLSPQASHPRVVGLMYVMLLAGSIASAVGFGAMLADFSPGRLIQAIQAAAVLTLVLNTAALWKQETRRPARFLAKTQAPDFRQAWREYASGDGAVRRLAAIALGTLGFGMQDVLLEPYGGQVLGMGVGATTSLTASLALGGLLGFSAASYVLGRGADPYRMSAAGAAVGVVGFGLVLASPAAGSVPVFVLGVLLIGLGGGLFGHGTLTATMNGAPAGQAGLALGTWGAVQATTAGAAIALGGLLGDGFGALAARGVLGPALRGPATGYMTVYAIEIALLLATVVTMFVPVRGARAPAPG